MMSEPGRDGRQPRIVDAHCHIASEEHIPTSFIEGAVANMAAVLAVKNGTNVKRTRIEDLYRQKIQDPVCDELVGEMDRAGVTKAILLIADFTVALRDCSLTIEESFRRHRAVLARHAGRFEVFGGVDPRWGSDGLALFERSVVDFGFRGFKVYPPCGFGPSDRTLFPFYEICAQYGLPVVVHIGPTSPALGFDTSNPLLLDNAARNFPAVSFIMAHGAVSFRQECVLMCAFRPNVYVDLSGYQTSLGTNGVDHALTDLVSRRINHKVVFGTDWPVFRLQGDQQSVIKGLLQEGGPLATVSPEDQALILHRNADRLLGRAEEGPREWPPARDESCISR